MVDPITFRLTPTLDPEERLEEAALWKAVYDETNGTARAVVDSLPATFGRLSKSEYEEPLCYWEDEAFLNQAQREFKTLPLKEAGREVDRLHGLGYGAFVKSTRPKHAIFRCPIGIPLIKVMGDMVYSFIDNGPPLMVQQMVSMTYEWRFFCVNRQIVTNSCNNSALTPMDYPLRSAYLTPNATAPTGDYPHYLGIRRDLLSVAEAIAKIMAHPSAIIDCAYIDDVPGCVELNPFRLGQFGLFACDVRALVKAVIKQHQK